jgi:hypothetical protein
MVVDKLSNHYVFLKYFNLLQLSCWPTKIMNHLSQDTLFEIASFLTVTEYCNSFILVCSTFYETTTYEIVWSHFYEQRLVADIAKLTEEKDNGIHRIRSLLSRHIQQNTTAKDRLLRGNGYLTALSQYCYAIRLHEFQKHISTAFKKPVNKKKREIENYLQFIEPYEMIFLEMNKLLTSCQDEENLKRRASIIKLIQDGETYHRKSFLQWFFIDLETTLANTSIPQSDVVKYTQEILYKLVHTYSVRIMGETEYKRAGKQGDHFALVAAIRTGVQPIIDTVIQLYQHEQQTHKLYDGTSLLANIIQYCPENYQVLLESPVLFPQGHIQTILKSPDSYMVYEKIIQRGSIRLMQYLFDNFGFEPEFNYYQCNNIVVHGHDVIIWCFDHGMHCHNDAYQPFLHAVITHTPSENSAGKTTLETVKLVLNHPECDISAVTTYQHDAIRTAASHNLKYAREIIQMLIEYGADPYRLYDARTALSVAINSCSFSKLMEIQDLLTNETTIRSFDENNENRVRQLLSRYITAEQPATVATVLKIWIDKFNIDLNEPDTFGQGTKEFFETRYPEYLGWVQEVFDVLGVELK